MTDTFDRLEGARSNLGVKAPVVAAAALPITLSGEQTVDDIALVEGDRCLVFGQTDSTQNGVWVVASSTWTRAKDFDGNTDFVRGTLVPVARGTAYTGKIFRVTSADPQVVGTNAITFSEFDEADDPDAASIVAAATTELGSLGAEQITITGNTGISSFGTTAATGFLATLYFSGTPLISHGATMILPGAANIQIVAGDTAIVRHEGSGTWRWLAFQRASGQPLTFGSSVQVFGQATLASAATTELGSLTENSITISGTTSITSFGTTAPTGAVKFLTFSGILTLTHSANIILPGSANIITADGDCAVAVHEGSGVWRIKNFTRRNRNFINTAATANTSTAENDLITQALSAGLLGSSNAALEIESWGFTGTGTTAALRRMRLYFGGTAVADSGAIALIGGTWRLRAIVARTTSTAAQTAIGDAIYTTGTTAISSAATLLTTPAENPNNSITVKVTGLTTAGASQITARGLIVRPIPLF